MRTIVTVIIISLVSLLNAQKLEKSWSSKKDFQTPESVLFDQAMNTVFVANMGKTYETQNGDGYISQMNLKGEVTNPKWVVGLNDPKGMAIKNGKLYVSDFKEFVVIDIKEAKIIKKYPVAGAKFLNDVAIDDNGRVYISDSHDKRIYVFENEKVTSWLNNDNLNDVNGLWYENNKLYAGNSAIWEIDIVSKKMRQRVDKAGGVDGLESIGNGDFIFSNWGGKIYVSDKEKVVKLLDTSNKKLNTADIDYIPQQKLVLVPTFFGNSVDAYKLVW